MDLCPQPSAQSLSVSRSVLVLALGQVLGQVPVLDEAVVKVRVAVAELKVRPRVNFAPGCHDGFQHPLVRLERADV